MLLRRYREQGDLQAREELIRQLLPLVKVIACRYRHRGVPLDDLIQTGTIGLIKAIDRFDTARGTALSSYAVPTIVGEIKRYLRDHGSIMHVPRPVQELGSRIGESAQQLTSELGRQPTLAELGRDLDADPEQLAEALAARASYTAGSGALRNSDDERVDLLELLGHDDPGFDRADARMIVCARLLELDPRAQRIVLLRYAHDLTQAEIATRVGCSQMHVSRILRRSLDLLQRGSKQPDHVAATRP